MTGGMSRRDFLRLGGTGLAGAALLGVAGCGGGAGGGGAGGKVQLTLWHQEQPPNRVKQFQKVIDAFNNSQKDIQVRQQVQNWEDAYQKTTSAIQAGTPPDLQFTIPDFTVAIKQTGAVQPVEDIVEEINSSHTFLERSEEHTSELQSRPYLVCRLLLEK